MVQSTWLTSRIQKLGLCQFLDSEESTNSNLRSLVKESEFDHLLVTHEEIRSTKGSPPIQYLRITDGKDQITLFGGTVQYWETMVNVCLDTLD